MYLDGGFKRENVWRNLEIRKAGKQEFFSSISAAVAVQIVFGTEQFSGNLAHRFVFVQSARGLAQSKTLRVF